MKRACAAVCILACLPAIAAPAGAADFGASVYIMPMYPTMRIREKYVRRKYLMYNVDPADLALIRKDSDPGAWKARYRELLTGEDAEEVLEAGAMLIPPRSGPSLQKKPGSSWFEGVSVSVHEVSSRKLVGRTSLGGAGFVVYGKRRKQTPEMQRSNALVADWKAEVSPGVDLRRHMRLRLNTVYKMCLSLEGGFYANLGVGHGDVAVESRCQYFVIARADDDQKRSRLFEEVGIWHRDRGETDKAIELLSKSLTYDPHNYMSSSVLGHLLEEKGEREKNPAHLERAKKIYLNMTKLGKKGELCWLWKKCDDIEIEMKIRADALEEKIRALEGEARRRR